ncbi:FO synthase subunit 1 [Durusdinium trenchii]|uniref:FO synthase subunit 1 n=1 Tax=Durusdinium trenchii TaxID=1381693 RepID=A0ABP0RAY3_9DINO
MCDPFDMTVLMELVLSEGFRANPNDPGTEKLAIWPITDAWLQDKYKPLPPLNPADEEDGPPPFGVAYIKGWRRSLAALICCEGVRSLDIQLDELTDNFKASLKVIHATVGAYDSTKAAVFAARGVTMATTGTRKAPNAMNFLRQFEVLGKAGEAEWNDAGKVARAFNVGKLESEAIVALQSKIHHDIVDELKSATRTRGMRSFVTHDLLSKGIFNISFTSQVAGLEQWSAYLTNGQNNELASLFLERLKGDWDRLPVGVKKAFTWKDASVIHAACGGYLGIRESFQKNVPAADFAAAEPEIKSQFSLAVLDNEILAFLEGSVPPIQLKNVRFVRTWVVVRDTY